MFLVIVDYVKPLEEVERHLDAHRDYLESLRIGNRFLAAGPQEPRTGGVYMLADMPRAEAQSIIDADPFRLHGIADYRLIEFHPNRTVDDILLDYLTRSAR